MVQTAVTDVVGGTVTTDDPLAAGRDEVLEFHELLAGVAAALLGERDDLVRDLAGDGGVLRSLEPLGGEVLDLLAAAFALQGLLHRGGDRLTDAVGTEVHAETELAEVLEQGVLPGRAVARGVGAVRAGREGSAVDGGATGGVRDHHVVAEQLGDGLDVRGLTAARASAGELEERLGELGVLHVGELVHILLVADLLVQVVEVGLLGLVLDVRDHGEGLVLGEADVHAVAATGAVVHGDGEGVLPVLEVRLALSHLDGGGSGGGFLVGEEERTDGGVRADEGAAVALDTLLGVPHRDHHGDAALLEGGGAGRHGAVGVRHEGADREGVAGLGVHDVRDFLDEGGSQTVLVRVLELGGQVGPLGRDVDLGVLATAVDGRVVHVHHVLTLLAIGLHDGVLHVLHGVLVGDDARDLEEGALEDGVRTVAEADFRSDLGRVDDIDLDVLPADDGLRVVRDVLDGLFLVPEAVQQQGAAFLDALQDVILAEVGRDVAGHEVGGVHQVRSLDGLLAEAQVRAGVAAGLLGVVVEVGLAVEVGVGTDDLDGVLVRAHGTVGTETVELALGGAGLHDGNLALDREGLEGDVIDDADGEVRLGLLHVEVVEHGDDLRRRGVLGGEAVAAAHDLDVVLALEEGLDIGEERLAHGAGLLGAVEDRDLADALREDGEEVLLGERTIEVAGDEMVSVTEPMATMMFSAVGSP